MNLIEYAPLLAQGLFITIGSLAFAGTLSLLVGTILGIMSCRMLSLPRFQRVIGLYTFIAKGIPAYVQILIAYFIIPSLLGISISGFVAASLALAFCSSGYVTEIVRSGMNAIPRGQWQAASVLGYCRQATVKRVIAPQAVPLVVSPLLGELEQLLKSTSLLATIGVTELTRSGMNIISRELNPIPVYLTLACMYLFLSAILNQMSRSLEQRMNYGNR